MDGGAARLQQAELDGIIQRLLLIPSDFPKGEVLQASELLRLCADIQPIISAEKTLVELHAPLNIIGDLHGQFTDLLRFLTARDFHHETFLFLGDYVDRGTRSLEVLCLLFALKIRFPNRFILLRGNHETEEINRIFGFYDECRCASG